MGCSAGLVSDISVSLSLIEPIDPQRYLRTAMMVILIVSRHSFSSKDSNDIVFVW
jgi:hypothetical protein